VTLLLVLALDLAVFGRAWPWMALGERVGTQHLLAAGIVSDYRMLAAVAQAPPRARRVAVLGSSRTQAALLGPPISLPPGVDGPLSMAILAHAGIDPYAIRSLADRLADLEFEVVVLHLSEFDTHRPPEPRAATSFGSAAGACEFAAALGPVRAWQARGLLLRLALAGSFAAYKHREVLDAFGMSRFRSFGWYERLVLALKSKENPNLLGLAVEPRRALDMRRLQQIKAEFELRGYRNFDVEMERVRTIRRGEHVDVQMRLLASAVRVLRRAGVRVVIVEAPLSPGAAEFYDLATRDDFKAFARNLARQDGVWFVPLAERYFEEDFLDYAHMGPSGRARAARAFEAAIGAALADRS
jgi:hypothetical protein